MLKVTKVTQMTDGYCINCLVARLESVTEKETLYIYQVKRGVPTLPKSTVTEISKADEEHIVSRLHANPEFFLAAARRRRAYCVTIYR